MAGPSDSVQAQAGVPSPASALCDPLGGAARDHGGDVNVRSIILFAVAILMIVVGFWTLARGSMTLAPVLLVAGYCVVVPFAIMARGGGADAAKGEDEGANSSAG